MVKGITERTDFFKNFCDRCIKVDVCIGYFTLADKMMPSYLVIKDCLEFVEKKEEIK